MSNYLDELAGSSVFRPIRLEQSIGSSGGVQSENKNKRIGRKVHELHEALEAAFDALECQDGDKLDWCLKKTISDDSVNAVLVFGELFIEVGERRIYLSDDSVSEYFVYLDRKFPIASIFSKAKMYLNDYVQNDKKEDFYHALEFFREGKERGNITSAILYGRLKKSELVERYQGKVGLKLLVEKVALFLFMVPVFSQSVEAITPSRWWRYQEINRLMPARVSEIDKKILDGYIEWV